MPSADVRTISNPTKTHSWRMNLAGSVVIVLALAVAFLAPNVVAQTATEQTLATTTASGLNGVIQASDGNFYGSGFPNSATDYGGIYRITPAGAITELYAFSTASGSYNSALTEGADGNLYGMTTS